jgi:tryptophan-rich sensory protein
VFGPVWTALYLMMGLALYLVWSRGLATEGVAVAVLLFALQLLLNGLWSWLFFGWQMPGWAFVDIVVLWVLIGITTVLFFRVSMPAGLLMVPYWAWVTFASVLNFAIWRLNA